MKYKKSIFDKVERELYELRKKFQDDLELRKAVLYKRDPEAKEIEKELAGTAIKVAKAVISGSNISKELEFLKNRNLELQEKLKKILKKFNLPEHYLDMEYNCKKCRDMGFVDGIMCECMKNLIKKQIYEDLNRLSPLSLSTFDTFSLDYYSDFSIKEGEQSPKERMGVIYKYCMSYAYNFSTNSRSVIMRGGTGLGKTHLSLAIANTVISSGFGVIYVSAPNMISYLEKEKFKNAELFFGSEEYFVDCDLLIIDDLGSEFSTQFSSAAMYNIVNSRIIMSKPTIINTNLSIKEIEKTYTERMVSRIIGGNVRLEFIGEDVRQQKRFSR